MRQSLRIAALVAGSVVLGACASVQGRSAGTSPGTEVRTVNGERYRVLGSGALVLYAHDRQVMEGKRVATAVDPFFSTTPTAPVQPLTLETLKKAYPNNHKFHDMLTVTFGSDAELTRYDDHHHEYLVTRLLRQSQATSPQPDSTQ
jgi:hypothetical protein